MTYQGKNEADLDAVVAALRDHGLFAVTSHENPDGDAIGSLLAAHLALRELGKDSVMVLGEQPIPAEYGFLSLDDHGLRKDIPTDIGERVLVAVDCAQGTRVAARGITEVAASVVNIDHHHDNTRFGDVNLVVGSASSAAEVLADVLSATDVRLTPGIAEALYTGLVTDTGRFQYANTTPKALRLAAELVEAGADVSRIFKEVYESVELPKLRLLGRAIGHASTHEEGRVVISHLTRQDFAEVEADEPYSEGIIDALRAVEGSELACLIRELAPGADANCKVSLRTSADDLDVSAIARLSSGGGHRQAAGFSSDLGIDAIKEFVLAAYREARLVQALDST
jgi:bifunctional oligoribonuclease and PAP phosphatase NrnA